MSAEELSRMSPGPSTEQQSWTVSSISRDGSRMTLVDADGNEMSVAVAPTALPRRSEKTTVNQGQTPTLRPRDIQARIRGGESPEAVADAAGTTLKRIMPFAAPVMAEREHMADRAQRATVRRQATESVARTLGDAVALQLSVVGAHEDAVEWDSWRRPDGRWVVAALYTTEKRSGAAEFTFDGPGNFVSLENDDARWLVSDLIEAEPEPEPEIALDDLSLARERRDTRVVEPITLEAPQTAPDVLDLDTRVPESLAAPVAPAFDVQPNAAAEIAESAINAAATTAETTDEVETGPRKPKRRGRASIPSWDEIMFGGADTKPDDEKTDPEV